MIFLIGFGVSGNQLILIGSSAALFPSDLRATSAGFTVAIARIGAVLAPLAGALALQSGVPAGTMMAALAIPMMVQFAVVHWARQQFSVPHAVDRP